ncbi:MAG: glycosyltransferase family 9 protein [Verrucomicrobiaceae bacterium]|nr:glycosyltransferase family 9 protein [Verrucomicrobiaceae bacterium]
MSAADAPAAVDLRDFKSALIVKPSSLGDIVHALPAVRFIKQAHPHLKLRWIVNSEWAPLVEGCPFVDEVIAFPRKSFRGITGGFRWLGWAARWNRARREPPEIVLDFQGLLRSALIAYARGADWITGMSDAREGASRFFDQVVAVDAQAHAVERSLALARACGVSAPAVEVVFDLPEGSAPDAFDAATPFVLLHPWSRGADKSLAPEALRTLCECLAGVRVVVVGVSGAAAPAAGGRLVDLTNLTTLPQLVWLMRRARACVSVDSGPMHLAAAVNDRTLGIHTWSDPRRVGPWNSAAWVWKAGRIAHRGEFSAGECARDARVTEADARRIADFVLGTLTA